MIFLHSISTAAASQNVMEWEFPLPIILPLEATAVLYLVGTVRELRRRPLARRDAIAIACFVFGWLSLLIALDSPIHAYSEQLFWVHMTQHEILLLISAPLLVLSRPAIVFLAALPLKWRRLVLTVVRERHLHSIGRKILSPLWAWAISGLALWIWHAPALFDAAVRSDWVHAAQHLSFFLSALLFWWALHGNGRRIGYGVAVIYLFATAVHTSVLGALLTFSATPWYAPYLTTTTRWGLTALEDQQLGGLIMWIPAGTILIVAALVFFVKWLDESQQRAAYTRTAALIAVPATTGEEVLSEN
jgi:putative membrane protein